MHQPQQRGQQHAEHRLDRGGRVAATGAIAGAKLDQQRDRLGLRDRAARKHRPVLAHHLAEGAQQLLLGMEPPRLALRQQQPGGDQRAPRRGLGQRIGRAARLALKPARGFLERRERARAGGAIGVRQDQRRVHQPVEQPPAGMADGPRAGAPRAARKLRMRVEPLPEQALGDRRHLLARRSGLEIGEPVEPVDRARDRRGEPRRVRKVERGERQHRAVHEQLPRPERGPRHPVARQRVLDRRQHPRLRLLRERRGEQPRGHADAVGGPDQPLTGAAPGQGQARKRRQLDRFGGGCEGIVVGLAGESLPRRLPHRGSRALGLIVPFARLAQQRLGHRSALPAQGGDVGRVAIRGRRRTSPIPPPARRRPPRRIAALSRG